MKKKSIKKRGSKIERKKVRHKRKWRQYTRMYNGTFKHIDIQTISSLSIIIRCKTHLYTLYKNGLSISFASGRWKCRLAMINIDINLYWIKSYARYVRSYENFLMYVNCKSCGSVWDEMESTAICRGDVRIAE